MSRIVWDAVGERKYTTGVDRGVLYQWDSDSAKFTNGKAWNGLTNVNETPSGAEATALYADNIKYLNLISAEEYGCTIEAYTYPDEFEQNDGSASIAQGVTIGQQSRKIFGFCYRTLLGNDVDGTDYGYELHLVYNCLASPSERAHSTVNDSPDATQLSWDVTTTPVTVPNFKPTACLTINSTKISAENLALIEEKLYGTSSSVAELPFPADIIAIAGTTGITGVVVTPSTATIGVGDKFLLGAVTVPDGAEIAWTSADDTKVTVSASGVVEGIAEGTSIVVTATITVDDTDYTDTCSVTVS